MTIDHALQCVKLGASDGYAAVLADEVRRLNTCLQWEQNRSGRIGTHGYDCWQWGPAHYECALGEIKRLREETRSSYKDGQDSQRAFYNDYYSPEHVDRMLNAVETERDRYRDVLIDTERVLEWGEPDPKPVLQRVRNAIWGEEE